MLRISYTGIALLLALVSNTGCSGSLQSEVAGQPEAADPRKDMQAVPAGDFLYGATDQQVDFFIYQSVFNYPGMVEIIRQQFVQPQRPERLDLFYIDRFEVTNRLFKGFLDATGYKPASDTDFLKHWQGGSFPEWAADFPVVWVSFEDAKAYCSWRGGSVPSELQWEKAARGADGRYFPWGNELADRDVANFASDTLEPAGNRPADVSPFGIYDLGGNVSELTKSDVPGGSEVVLRGGSFKAGAREMLTCWRDLSATPSTRQDHVGFRCVAH